MSSPFTRAAPATPAEDLPTGPSPLEAHIEAAVERAVMRALRPYLRRICEPEPAVYSVAQAAVVLQVSEDTVTRLIRRGVVDRVPHVDGKILIPRASVERLIDSATEEAHDRPA